MAIQTQVWAADIHEALYAGVPFLTESDDHSAFLNYRTVNVPQMGASPTVVKNPATYPLTIARRDDNVQAYNIDFYAMQPIVVPMEEEQWDSFDKRQSVSRTQLLALTERVGVDLLFAWATNTAGNTLIPAAAADGTGPRVTVAGTLATGNRRPLATADLGRLAARMDNDKIPKQGRKLLIPSDVYYTVLLNFDEVRRADAYNAGRPSNLSTGIVAQLYGFEIMTYPSSLVPAYNGTTFARLGQDAITGLPTGGAAATNSYALMAWHPGFVARALGSINTIINANAPGYSGGTVIESNLLFGGSKLRTNDLGIYSLILGT